MKTAMQELLEWHRKSMRSYSETNKMIEAYHEKEKEQIIDAYWGGLNGKLNVYSESDKEFVYGKGAEMYYDKKYQNK
jgi:hypothetical protein